MISYNSMEGVAKNHETTWDKLESVLNYEDLFSYNELNHKTVEPVRKFSANSSRISGKRYEARSISISKESILRQKRPNTSLSISISRTNTTLSTVPGLSFSQVQNIYSAKCLDLGIPLLPDQERRFFNFCSMNFQNRRFSLKDSGLGCHSAKRIGEIIKNTNYFAYIDLGKNNLKDQGAVILVKYLKKSINVVHLDISSNEITCEGSETLILELLDHQSLISFDISSHEGLHRNRLGIQGARAIGKVLQSKSILAFLHLAGTGLGPEGLEYLLEGLKNNLTITSLNLANNLLGGKCIEKLAVVLVGTELKELNLAVNKIGNEGCEYISIMVSGGYDGCCTIMKIDLSENEINTLGISKIFAALRINSQLKQLDFRKNQLNKGLSLNMLQCFVENFSLELLNLSYCELKCDGFVGIAEGLSKNHGLKSLFLNNNFIQDKGAEIIALGLAKNKTLKLLDLSSNKIREKGGLSLGKALHINHSIENLLLRDNMLNDECGHIFCEISRFKRNLLKLNLELNPMNFKYVNDIKNNVLNNIDHHQKTLVPKLRTIIDKIFIDNNAIDDLNSKIALKQREKNDAKNKLKNQGNKLENAKETENEKLMKLKNEYDSLREHSMKLSEEIDELALLTNV